nr:cytochrome c oxidase subunit 3 [Myrsidea ptilorhynchi]
MMSSGFVTFHIVDESPWPLYMSVSAFCLMASLVELCTLYSLNTLKIGVIITFSMLTFKGWLRDVTIEGTFLGYHTMLVQKGLKMGFVLFILSEVMFFACFFWSLFYYSISPSVAIGGWPPTGVTSVNPLGIPLLGTIILMSSGISVTWSHYAMMAGNKNHSVKALLVTLVLGVTFTLLQLMEYLESSFSMSDSAYGSIFYMTTGFHGMHVLVGSIFLAVNLGRIFVNHLSKLHHVGLEFAIWYWHFVDVVWLALYLFLYWWGW